MKKLITTIVLLLSVMVSFSQTQTERIPLFKSNMGYSIYEAKTDLLSEVYFAYTYKNEKYKHISDVAIIVINEKEELKSFSEKLLEFSKKEKGTALEYASKRFTFCLFDFSNSIYVFDKNKSKYQTLSKQKAKELAEEISTQVELLTK